jgi:hypothetical protein
MLQSKVTDYTRLTLTLLILQAALIATIATAEETSADLNILRQADALEPFMTVGQKIAYAKLEAELDSARSDLRSGKHLANTKASSFDPNRDLKPIIDRGKKLVLKSEATINAKLIEMAQFLLNISEKNSRKRAADLTKYDYRLVSSDLNSALVNYSHTLLDACWKLGYETLFFHTAFIRNLKEKQQVSEPIRKLAYDALTQADGSRFSVRIPVDFELNYEKVGQGTEIFSYENSDLFQGEKKALLAIELTVPNGSSTGLLLMHAIDLCTEQIVAHELIKIFDLTEVINSQEEYSQDYYTDMVQLRDPSRTIDVLSQLSTPYTFELAADPSIAPVNELLTHTLIKNSKLKIVATDFINRSYGKATKERTHWTGSANATISIEMADKEDAYQVNANANKRSLSIGMLTLKP